MSVGIGSGSTVPIQPPNDPQALTEDVPTPERPPTTEPDSEPGNPHILDHTTASTWQVTGYANPYAYLLGVPGIALPQGRLSPELVRMFVNNFVGDTERTQIDSALMKLETSKRKKEEINATQQVEHQKWMDACEAARKAAASGMPKWLQPLLEIFTAVLAVALTVATAGAAAPLAAAAIGSATISVANSISNTTGGPSLSLADAMAKGFTEMLDAMGVDPEEARKVGNFVTGLMVGIVAPPLLLLDPKFAGNMMSGFAELVGGNEEDAALVNAAFTLVASIAVSLATMQLGKATAAGAATAGGVTGAVASTAPKALGVTASKVVKVAHGVGAGAEVTSGATGIASGVAKLNIADLDAEAATALNEIDALDALLIGFTLMQERMIEALEKAHKEHEEKMKYITETMAADSQEVTAITSRISSPV